jgi:hypothetical protein
VEAAIQYWVDGVEEDKSQRFSACWILAVHLDRLKCGWAVQSPGATASGTTNFSQVPLASVQLEELAAKIRQQQFSQCTPSFQNQQDAEHYMTGVSATDAFRTTIHDVASYIGVAESAVTTYLLTGQSFHISAANLTTIAYTITMPDRSSESLPKVHVSFNDSNFRAWKQLPQHVRQAHRPPGGRAPTPKQAEVYTFVQQLGGPPGRKGEDKLWWENIAASAWNKTHPDRPLQADSLRKEYQDATHALRQRDNPLMP